jgi:hypothetical protein
MVNGGKSSSHFFFLISEKATVCPVVKQARVHLLDLGYPVLCGPVRSMKTVSESLFLRLGRSELLDKSQMKRCSIILKSRERIIQMHSSPDIRYRRAQHKNVPASSSSAFTMAFDRWWGIDLLASLMRFCAESAVMNLTGVCNGDTSKDYCSVRYFPHSPLHSALLIHSIDCVRRLHLTLFLLISSSRGLLEVSPLLRHTATTCQLSGLFCSLRC